VTELLDAYFRSLKPLEVEEPIDVWVHRPPAYVLARILMPTPVSPNLVTIGSIVFGCAAGAAIFARFRGHLQLAGCLFSAPRCSIARMGSWRACARARRRLGECWTAWLIWWCRRWSSGRRVARDAQISRPRVAVRCRWHADGDHDCHRVVPHHDVRSVQERVLAHDAPELPRGRGSGGRRAALSRAACADVVRAQAGLGIYFFYMRSQKDYADKFDPNARRLLFEFRTSASETRPSTASTRARSCACGVTTSVLARWCSGSRSPSAWT